ncbi:MAG: hypothetical protein A2Z25_00210 [Planctomycetes bacterium RBG_16_55_9]|nr:MAG: hypothetical protein A2Z25_00210 [Planctomycetes bacterium RBG_16_55_9]
MRKRPLPLWQEYDLRLFVKKELIHARQSADMIVDESAQRIRFGFTGRRNMQKDKLYQRIGELTVQFATLEHRLQQLLELLMGKDNSLIGPLFIHHLRLTALLRKITIVAHYRVQEDSPLLRDLIRALKAIETVGEERNLLIHGEWQIKDTSSFPVKVRDFRMRYEEGDWQEYTETALTEKKVTYLVRRLKGLVNDIDYLIREFGNSQMVPRIASSAS